MTEVDVRTAIIDIIHQIAPDAETGAIVDTESLKDQVGLDSMDFLDLVMELRKRHQIEVPKEDYKRLDTMENCVSYLRPKFSKLAA